MFGIFNRKKKAEDAGRELAEALMLVMPYNQSQVENMLGEMGVPISRNDSRLELIPFGLAAFAICPMMEQPWAPRLCESVARELMSRMPGCFPRPVASNISPGQALMAASQALKAAIMAHSSANSGAVRGYLDLIDPSLGQQHADTGDVSRDADLARILQRPVSAAMELMRSYTIN